MIEVFVFIEPLNGQVSLIGVQESLIFRVDVFLSALFGDESGRVSFGEVVAQSDSEREPGVLDFWIFCLRNV